MSRAVREGPKPSVARDLLAGVSVALVLVPQGLAYADLAGMPPWHGLYAGAVAPLLAAPFVSSRYLQTGPVALTSLLTFGALAGMAATGSAEYVALAALLALVVGAVRLVIGLSRSGALAYLMSQPVLLGFTPAAALLILSSQLPAALGVQAEGGTVLARAFDAAISPGAWTWGAVALTALTVALVKGGPKLHALFPGVLVAMLVGLGAGALGLPVGDLVGEVPEGFPPFSLDLPWASLPSLIVPGAVIALVGFAEAAAIARTFAAADREYWDPNREFVSQGAANLAAGVFSGFPVGGSFSRSSLTRVAGGASRLAGAATGVAVLAALPAVGLLSVLPRAILGAVVLAAVSSLFRIAPLVRMWKQSKPQAVVAWGTFFGCLWGAPHVEYGVIGGVALAAGVHLWREMRLDVGVEEKDGVLTLRPMGVLWYGTTASLEQALVEALARHPHAERLRVDLSRLGRIDLTGAAALSTLVTDAVAFAGLEVDVVGCPPSAKRIVARLLPGEVLHDEPAESPSEPAKTASVR